MSQAPILPPLPPGYGPSSQSSSRPPLPPLPQGYHNSNPDVVAPRPQRTTPAVPTSHLETQAASWGPAQPQRAPSPFIPGPLVSSAYGASPYIPQQPATPPVAPPYGAPQQGRPMHQPAATPGFPGYGSPAGNMPVPTQSRPPRQSSSMNLTANFNNLTIDDRRASSPAVQLSSYPGQGSPKQFGTPPVAPRMGPPQLPKPLTQKDLSAMRELVVSSDDLGKRVQWAKEVLKFVERSQAAATTASAIVDPLLIQWIEQAMQYISFGAGSDPGPSTVPPSLLQLAVAEAMFLRADLASSGTFPTYFPKNPRSSFRDFEASANLGFAESWFKIGKAYESFDNFRSAVDAYNRGVRLGESHCLFRMGMATLLGQLDLRSNPPEAVRILESAARASTPDNSEPAYVWGMLLAGEFAALPIPEGTLPTNPANGRKWLEWAAEMGYPAAQYKCGLNYEHAQMTCEFNPLLSVQYYSAASQQGEAEADMALSKWFLCGAEGSFDMNEGLAVTFAEKAAKKGLPTAEFAVAYYKEVGIGGQKDLEAAQRWYRKAQEHGNEDATNRLRALSDGSAPLTRTEHQSNVTQKLVRKRTQAQNRTQNGQGFQQQQQQQPQQQQQQQQYQQQQQQQQQPQQRPQQGGYTTSLSARDTIRRAQQAASQPEPQINAIPSGPPAGSPYHRREGTLPNVPSGYPPNRDPSPRPAGRPDTGSSVGSATGGAGRRPRPDHASTMGGPAPSQAQPHYPGPPSSTGSLPTPLPPTNDQMASVTVAPPKKGPATFQDMGLTSTQLKKEECIIV